MTIRDDLPVTDEELHAYVDGELPADRLEAVSAWLATYPDAAAQVASWRAQGEMIRARYGATISEPVPARLKLERVLRGGQSWRAMAAAAAVAAFLIGGGAGWYAHSFTQASGNIFDRVAVEALDAYKLYVVEVRHPVEVAGDDRAHMRQWLSKRLGYEQLIPDLQSIGLKLIGGRLLPGPDGSAAAFYMYEGQSGERFTIYCSKTNVPETALRYKDHDQVAAFYWVDDKRAFVVSGPADRGQMEKVTRAIYEQIDPLGAKRL
jgi:anti-sigma factor RsiW